MLEKEQCFTIIFLFPTAKVTFRILLPNGRRQELHGSVDKERSHQNVLLVKTPSLTQLSYQFPHQTIRAEVVVVTGRNQMSSNALQFDFIPNRKYFCPPPPPPRYDNDHLGEDLNHHHV